MSHKQFAAHQTRQRQTGEKQSGLTTPY
eukprot:UN18276